LGKTFAKWVRERRVPRDARAKRNVQNVQKNILNGLTQSHHPHNLRDALSDPRFRAISRRRTLPKQKFRESAREEKKKAIERIDANARDATTRRFRSQTDTMRE